MSIHIGLYRSCRTYINCLSAVLSLRMDSSSSIKESIEYSSPLQLVNSRAVRVIHRRMSTCHMVNSLNKWKESARNLLSAVRHLWAERSELVNDELWMVRLGWAARPYASPHRTLVLKRDEFQCHIHREHRLRMWCMCVMEKAGFSIFRCLRWCSPVIYYQLMAACKNLSPDLRLTEDCNQIDCAVAIFHHQYWSFIWEVVMDRESDKHSCMSFLWKFQASISKSFEKLPARVLCSRSWEEQDETHLSKRMWNWA